MAISVADNFSYLGTKPLDARISFDTVSAMASASEATLYDGCFAYVKATQKYYSYDSNNASDPTTGKWREYSSGSGGTSDYTDLTNKPSINGTELIGNKVVGLLSTDIKVDSDKIGYDNLTSGLLATNVKSALDELKSSIVDSYANLSNKPSINGEELLGNKVIGLLSGDIKVDSDKIGYNNTVSGLLATNVKSALDELANNANSYADLSNKPSINGTELLGNKVIGLLSTNIQVGSNVISYDNTASGLSATNVKNAIDELKSSIPQSGGKGQSGTGTNSEIFNDYTNNTASGNYSHAEGYDNDAIGMNSHAEGGVNTATGDYSHAEGQSTHAKALGSHSSGLGTIASVNYETAVGRYNVDESGAGASTRFVVGNGADQNNRSDAFKVTDTEIHMNGDVKHNGSNLITASTTDITAGTTALTTGNLYLVIDVIE